MPAAALGVKPYHTAHPASAHARTVLPPLQVLFAFEEAIGFMLGPYKDKDGISAAAVFCEMAADVYARKATLQGTLAALYDRCLCQISYEMD